MRQTEVLHITAPKDMVAVLRECSERLGYSLSRTASEAMREGLVSKGALREYQWSDAAPAGK